MFKSGILLSIVLYLLAGALFITEGVYVLYYPFDGLQALLWSFNFYNATLFLFFSGLILCIAAIYVLMELAFKDDFNRYVVIFLLTKAIVVEIGFSFGFPNVAQELNQELPESLKNGLIFASNEKDFQTADFTESWNKLQTNYKCCGVYSPRDWMEVGMEVPRSCCGGEETLCGGCLAPLKHQVYKSLVLVWLLAVLLGLAIVVNVIAITACFSCFRRTDRRSYYEQI